MMKSPQRNARALESPAQMSDAASPDHSLFASHPRRYIHNRYIYPVISRRAGGISIGVNLNLDKLCNFRCVYCQVDRSVPGDKKPVDLGRLAAELDEVVGEITSGRIFALGQFCQTPAPLRRLNDIAFSGDGEPTAYPEFDRAVEACAEIRRRHALNDVKMVLITNATLFHRPRVQQALEILDANGGEIWAKLDAGTASYYGQIDRSQVTWQRILDNLQSAARARPIVIQSLFMRLHGQPPADDELEAYCQRLQELLAHGGQVKLVQVHTVARKPAEPWVEGLVNSEVDAIAERVRRRTGLPVAAYYAYAK